jgi:hypothetical protein
MNSSEELKLERMIGQFDLSDEEVEQNYAYRERYDLSGDGRESTLDDLESLISPDVASQELDVRLLISEAAHELICFYEVSGPSGYERKYKFPCWPGLQSGITIGIGYDIGYNKPKAFENSWKTLLNEGAYNRLSTTVGKKGGTAQSMLASVKDILVPWEDAQTVYRNVTVPVFAKLVLSAFPHARALHPHSFGALFSLVYNRGASLTGARRQHMRNIRDHLATGRLQAIPSEFRAMTILWPQSMSGLHKRREQEARLFEQGLIESAKSKIVSVPAAPMHSQTTGHADTVGFPGTQSGVTATNQPRGSLIEAMTRPTDLEAMRPGPDAEGDWEGEPEDLTDDMPPPPAFMPELEAAPAPWTAVSWPKNDDVSTDYRHLRNEDRELAGCSFDLTATDLELLIRANGFEPLRTNDRIIFGLRGARLEASTSSSADKSYQINRASLRLRESRPDHTDFNCVIGIYHVDSQRLSGFIASTVPKRSAVHAASKKQGKGCNLLPTGCYAYVVGPHRGKSGCLREDEPFTVLRTHANLAYDTGDDWTPGWPFDNIHPAFYADASAKFSSLGCQVIEGSVNKATGAHTGVWAKFRQALGLAKPGAGDHGTKFSYVLLTGLEAAIAARLREEARSTDFVAVLSHLGRLRHGSRGILVTKLQKALGVPETGKFDAEMRKKLTDRQKLMAGLGWADGVHGPEMDRLLSFDVFGSEQQEPIVIASAHPTGRLTESAADPLESLYYEIGRRAVIARTNPQLAAETYLPQLETVTTESFFDVLGMGQRVFARIERAAHDLICGDQSSDATDRDAIQQALLDAAKIGPEQVKQRLTEILTVSLGVLGPIAAIAARIIVEKVLEPALKDAHTQVAPMLQGACTAWARELNKRVMLAGLVPSGQSTATSAVDPDRSRVV